MLGFLGGVSRKLALSIAGMALTSGGAVGLSHSLPEILKGAGIGVGCVRPNESEIIKINARQAGSTTSGTQLVGGKFYLASQKSANGETKLLQATEKINNGTINTICAN